MGWLHAAWTGASRVQKIVIVVAALFIVGAIATIASPSPSATESPAASIDTHATPTAAATTPPPTPSPTPVPTAAPTPSPTPSPSPVPTPVPTSLPSLPLTFTSLTSPVAGGSNATAKIHTAPGAYCTIDVEYKSGSSTAAGLDPKTANGSGNASWTWRVGPNTTPGSWPVTVTCSKGDQSASVTKYLKVT
jgi:hypothetical protein